MALSTVARIQPTCVSALHPSHPVAQVRFSRFDNGVVVRVHEGARMHDPSEIASDTVESVEVGRSVAIVLDDPSAAAPLRDGMVDGARCLVARRSCHSESVAVVEVADEMAEGDMHATAEHVSG